MLPNCTEVGGRPQRHETGGYVYALCWFDDNVPDVVARAADALGRARAINPHGNMTMLERNAVDALQLWAAGVLDDEPILRFAVPRGA